jgi:hypothetical protein
LAKADWLQSVTHHNRDRSNRILLLMLWPKRSLAITVRDEQPRRNPKGVRGLSTRGHGRDCPLKGLNL